MLSVRLFPILLLLLMGLVGQSPGQGRGHISLQVFVYYGDTQELVHDPSVHVQLLDSWSMVEAEQDTARGGVLQFFTQPGLHYLRVTGETVDFQEFDFEIGQREGTHTETVHVSAKNEGSEHAKTPKSTVAAVRLKIPKKARREFDKGVNALDRKEWAEARTRFQTAISLYPQFDMAYNGLGLVSLNTGDFAAAETALQQAIRLNENYADAYRNLARIRLAQKNYVVADSLLQRSFSTEPRNVWALSYASFSELLIGRLDDTIANAQKLHSLPHEGYASTHLIAARAWEQKGAPDEALKEYELYLKEDPTGSNAQRARDAITRIKHANSK